MTDKIPYISSFYIQPDKIINISKEKKDIPEKQKDFVWFFQGWNCYNNPRNENQNKKQEGL